MGHGCAGLMSSSHTVVDIGTPNVSECKLIILPKDVLNNLLRSLCSLSLRLWNVELANINSLHFSFVCHRNTHCILVIFQQNMANDKM